MSEVSRLQPRSAPSNLGKVTYLGSRPRELPLGRFEPHEECVCWSCRHSRLWARVSPKARRYATLVAWGVIIVAAAYGVSVSP